MSEPPPIDPLRFVYLLVLDGDGPPDLLIHVDPSRFREAAARFLGLDSSAPREWMLQAQGLLFDKYPHVHPQPLWRAWMETTQGTAVERLRAELLGSPPS